MNILHLVDQLCGVTETMAGIIREQALFIENCKTIDRETKQEYAALREPAETELDLIEIGLRPIHSTGCRREDIDGYTYNEGGT